jgi:hypothetical protein
MIADLHLRERKTTLLIREADLGFPSVASHVRYALYVISYVSKNSFQTKRHGVRFVDPLRRMKTNCRQLSMIEKEKRNRGYPL